MIIETHYFYNGRLFPLPKENKHEESISHGKPAVNRPRNNAAQDLLEYALTRADKITEHGR